MQVVFMFIKGILFILVLAFIFNVLYLIALHFVRKYYANAIVVALRASYIIEDEDRARAEVYNLLERLDMKEINRIGFKAELKRIIEEEIAKKEGGLV